MSGSGLWVLVVANGKSNFEPTLWLGCIYTRVCAVSLYCR